MGSAETTFYVLAVYLGAVGISEKARYLVPVCVVADLVGIVLAIYHRKNPFSSPGGKN